MEKKYFNVTYRVSEDVWSANLAHAENVDDVRAYYERSNHVTGDDVIVSDADDYAVEDAQRRHKPIVEIDHVEPTAIETAPADIASAVKSPFAVVDAAGVIMPADSETEARELAAGYPGATAYQVEPAAVEEAVEGQAAALERINQIRTAIDARSARSAWSRGVNAYVSDLLDELDEAVRSGWRDMDDFSNTRMLEKALLNGANDWSQYSWGGCSLCYDSQIAKRVCAPWELRKTRSGEKEPNPRESWLDVQARALYQAAHLIICANSNI